MDCNGLVFRQYFPRYHRRNSLETRTLVEVLLPRSLATHGCLLRDKEVVVWCQLRARTLALVQTLPFCLGLSMSGHPGGTVFILPP